jgi:hypothetical protein
MAMKTSTPWWLTGVLFFGLLCLFAGLRALAHMDTTSTVLTGLGLLCVIGATGVRVWAFTRETGRRRAVEGVMLLCHAGVAVALLLYFFVAAKDDVSHKTYIMATVTWLVVLGLSLIPLFMIETSLGFVGRDWFPQKGEKVADEAAVELFRVKEMATNGLTIALAAAFLMVTCNAMKDRNIQKDVSYFKTSGPGSATVAMVNKMDAPLRVLLFFPDVNQVADEVEAYFRQLGDATGKVVVERHDRLVSPTLAKDHKVNADGTVVLLRGEPADKKDDKKDAKEEKKEDKPAPVASQEEKLTLPTDFTKARRDKLREFDADVQKALMKVVRAKRVAYFSVGHGELNDPKSTGPMETQDPLARSTLLKQLMSLLNYEVKDWDGFGKPVPDDCTILFVLGPRHELLDEELQAIDDYLEKGGSLLLVLDPQSKATNLGPLEGRLGVKFNPGVLMDDKEFMVQQHNSSDHRLILTNQFSSHASVTTLSRGGVRSGILLIESGHLEPHDFMVEQGKQPPKRTWVIRSMSSAFVDLPDAEHPSGDREYNDASEKRDRYNIAAAVEDDNDKTDKNKEEAKTGMRAMVFADSEVFSDVLLRKVPLIQALVVDAVKWLGGEEDLAGETISEKDVLIEHTKSEDVVWFYLSLVGAPVLILGLGLSTVMWRRRRAQRRKAS